MWHQGESDRNAANAYYENFKTMIAYMRNAIYEKTGDEADNSMTIRLEGKDHYAFLGFDGGLISLRLFGTGPDSDHFGYFTAK